MLVASLSADSLLYTAHGWQPCAAIIESAELLGVDRHGKLVFEKAYLGATDRQTRPIFVGTARSCGIFSPSSLIHDSNGDRKQASALVDEMAIGKLRFEITNGCSTNISLVHAACDAIWQALSTEGVSGNDCIRIRARRPIDDERLPKETKVWGFMRLNDRIYGTTKKTFQHVDFDGTELADFVSGLLYLFRNEEGICEFGRNTSLIAMIVADHCARNHRDFVMKFDSLQHSAVLGLAIDHADTHALARGLCAYTLPRPIPEHELQWESASWNPVSGGLILSGRPN